MLRINNKERQRILEIHRNNSMKPWLSKLLNEQSDLYSSIKTKQQGDAFRDWVITNYPNVASTYNLDPSSHPNSIYFYSESMKNAWNYYDPNKKAKLGDLFLNSSSYTQSNNKWPGRNIDDPGADWEFEKKPQDVLNSIELDYFREKDDRLWQDRMKPSQIKALSDSYKPKVFNEKDFNGKAPGDVRDYNWFYSFKLLQFLMDNFPEFTNKNDLRNISTIWDSNLINWVLSQDATYKYSMGTKNIGEEWRTYRAKTLNDWKKELTKNNYVVPSWVDTEIERAQNQAYFTKPGTQAPKQKPIDELTYEEKRAWDHAKIQILQFAAILIPYVGIPLAGIIGLADAKMYEQDGDEESASLSYLLALLPFTTYFSKIPIVSRYLANKTLVPKLAKKIIGGGSYTKDELILLKEISKGLADEGGKTEVLKKLITEARNVLGDPTKAKNLVKDAAKYNKLKFIAEVGLEGLFFFSDWESSLANPLSNVIYGKSVKDILKQRYPNKENIDEIINNWKNEFYWRSEKDDENMIKALTDINATFCNTWSPNKPVPKKYQTQAYKDNIVDIIRELSFLELDPLKDCRYPGTFTRPLDLESQDFQYKFDNGKYYARLKQGVEKAYIKGYPQEILKTGKWFEIKDANEIKRVESYFLREKLIKDDKGLYYTDKEV